jgi:hypothetical protein
MQSLRIAPILNGYRGACGINWKSLERTLDALQRAVEQLRNSLVELEINPLLCTPEQCIASDALLRLRSVKH